MINRIKVIVGCIKVVVGSYSATIAWKNSGNMCAYFKC